MENLINIKNLNKNVFLDLKREMGDVLNDRKILGPPEIAQWIFGEKNLPNEQLIAHFGAIDFSLEMIGYSSDRDDNDEVDEVDLLLIYKNHQPFKLITALSTKLTSLKKDVIVAYTID
jgi:hypothetical protein